MLDTVTKFSAQKRHDVPRARQPSWRDRPATGLELDAFVLRQVLLEDEVLREVPAAERARKNELGLELVRVLLAQLVERLDVDPPPPTISFWIRLASLMRSYSTYSTGLIVFGAPSGETGAPTARQCAPDPHREWHALHVQLRRPPPVTPYSSSSQGAVDPRWSPFGKPLVVAGAIPRGSPALRGSGRR